MSKRSLCRGVTYADTAWPGHPFGHAEFASERGHGAEFFYDEKTDRIYTVDSGFSGMSLYDVCEALDEQGEDLEDLKVGDRLRFKEWRGDDHAKLDGKIVEIVSIDNPGPYPVIGRWEHLKKNRSKCYLPADVMHSSGGVRCFERVK